jgi:hypothetical protein
MDEEAKRQPSAENGRLRRSGNEVQRSEYTKHYIEQPRCGSRAPENTLQSKDFVDLYRTYQVPKITEEENLKEKILQF